MKTRLFKPEELKEAAVILRKGGTVAFPTETVYGLGANALDPEAVKKIFMAKGRPGDNPLIVHIAELSQLEELVKEVPDKAEELIKAFWPGPITLIMEKSDKIPEVVSAGLTTVGIRMPKDQVGRAFLREVGIPVAAPSANISGRPSTTSSESTLEDLKGRVDGIILSDVSEVGIESTVIDMTKETPVILRPGIISKKMIEDVIGEVQLSEGITTGVAPKRPASPGMKYTHYSPEAEVILVKGNRNQVREKILNETQDQKSSSAVFITLNSDGDYPEGLYKKSFNDEYDLGKRVYRELREADKNGINRIYIELPEITDKNLFVIDRLLHASAYTVI